MCQTVLKVGRRDIRSGGEEAHHSEAESAEDEYQQRHDYAENELAHGSSGANIVADGRGWALVGSGRTVFFRMRDRSEQRRRFELRSTDSRGAAVPHVFSAYCSPALLLSIRFQAAGFADHVFQLGQVV